MLRLLLDTDHLTLLEHGHPPLKLHLASQPQGTVGLPVVTVEESLRGRLAAISMRTERQGTHCPLWLPSGYASTLASIPIRTV